ncbi:uncharacterized protein LOC121641222 isoform X5 [Melanotaenia boesemani]|uniref:uncharacterized protein LOC121641222 isoform X5 n=1 Tax=Melanotaenia boesemani TaxID=1250792 RepID=UPI001C05DD9E|nr:uncharacterized protein LOC121641222 isoform X5 [Melanotaenia boesemani]
MKMIVWFGFVLCALSAAGKDFITEVGGKVNLECGVNDVKNQLFWYKGSEMVRNVKYMSNIPTKGSGDANSEIAKRSRIKLANLEIYDVKQTDAGEFRCVADGKTFPHTLAVVSESAPWTTAPSSSTSGENYESTCVQYETDCHTCDDVKLLGLPMHVWAALVAGGLVLVFFIIFVVIICTMVKRKKSNVLDHSEDCVFCYLDDLEYMDVFEGGRSAAESEGGRDHPPGPRVRDGPGKDELLAFISRTGMNPMCDHYICHIK